MPQFINYYLILESIMKYIINHIYYSINNKGINMNRSKKYGLSKELFIYRNSM